MGRSGIPSEVVMNCEKAHHVVSFLSGRNAPHPVHDRLSCWIFLLFSLLMVEKTYLSFHFYVIISQDYTTQTNVLANSDNPCRRHMRVGTIVRLSAREEWAAQVLLCSVLSRYYNVICF